MIGSGTDLDQADTRGERLEREIDVHRNGACLEEGVEGGEEWTGDGLEPGVGVGESGLEGVDVGEEGLEVVDGHDEVLVVGLADLLDFRLLGSRKVAEVVVQSLGLPRREGLADEGPQVLVVAYGRGEQHLLQLVR